MTTLSAIISIIVILVAFYGIWRITQKPTNIVVIPQRASELTPINKTIIISPDQEKQYVGRDYAIAITEPSLLPVNVTIVRSSTNTQISRTYERPANGSLSTRILINQGEFLRAPFPITLQIQWNAINSQTMQITQPKHWWQL